MPKLKEVFETPITVRMLRTDSKIEFVQLPWSPETMVSGRYTLRSGKTIHQIRWRKSEFEAIRAERTQTPVALIREGHRRLWTMGKAFYWADEGLEAEDVKALIHERTRRSQRKLETAKSLLRADESVRPKRVPIPTELRRAVFERDGGRCVQCGSHFELQYDHILPVAHGGATTLENLELLCADCNRRKGDFL